MTKLYLKVAELQVGLNKTALVLTHELQSSFLSQGVNKPLKQTWWRKFRYTSTPQAWLSCPLWCLGKSCTPLCLQSILTADRILQWEHITHYMKCTKSTYYMFVLKKKKKKKVRAVHTSPRTTIIWISGVSWYRRTWSMKVEPGYLDKEDTTPQLKTLLHRDMFQKIIILRPKPVNTPVSSNGHPFIHAICRAGDDVVQLVGHASRAWHIRHTTRAIKFGS